LYITIFLPCKFCTKISLKKLQKNSEKLCQKYATFLPILKKPAISKLPKVRNSLIYNTINQFLKSCADFQLVAFFQCQNQGKINAF